MLDDGIKRLGVQGQLQEHAIKLSGKKEDLINRLIIYYYNMEHQDL